ncbi:galactose mutarotase isoform X1 [Melanerpes formicivorus]|uniref:galactose mutarotase isoform X1 n=1 Tax=Melanerpes formicivorus TaxID=211600 RepID=UPI00358F122E
MTAPGSCLPPAPGCHCFALLCFALLPPSLLRRQLPGAVLLAAFRGAMTEVKREVFGQMPPEQGGGVVEKFTLKSDSLKVEILSLGCIIAALEVKGRDGKFTDVVLGFDTLEGYTRKHPFFGAVVGRVANRIAKGRFTLEGKDYQLFINNGPNSLHGGAKGFDKVLWSPQVLPNGVCFFRLSPDGEEGYPGDLQVWVTYTLSGKELAINYRAQASQVTPISLTNHAYFNLAGQGSGDIYDHEISIEADSYLPVDDTKIPTGEVAAVQGTGFDLRQPVELGKQLRSFHLDGFDHNFCLRQAGARRLAARARHPPTGRALEVHTTQPGIQFYTGNNLDGSLKGKGAATYPKHSAFCLETQGWPDAVNKPHFPSTLLRPGEEYNHTTWLLFSSA